MHIDDRSDVGIVSLPGRHATGDEQQATGDKTRWSGLFRQLGGRDIGSENRTSASVIGCLEYGALAWAAGGQNRVKMCHAEEFWSDRASWQAQNGR